MDSGGVDERHAAHSYHPHLRTVAERCHHILEPVCDTEEVRSVDFIDLDSVRNREGFLFGRIEVRLRSRIYLVRDYGNLRGLHYSLYEEDAGDEKSDADGYGKVEQYSQEKGEEEYDDVGLGVVEEFPEGSPAAHVVRNDHEDSAEACHRDILCQRHEEEEYQEQYDRMDDTCHRGLSSVIDIGHGPGDCAGGRDAAENRGDHVGDAEGDEFGVGIMFVSDDAVRNGCGEERLDGGEHCNGDGYREKFPDGLPSEGGHGRCRDACLDGETVTDGVDAGDTSVGLHYPYGNRDNDNRDEGARNPAGETGGHYNKKNTDHGNSYRPPVDSAYMFGIESQFADKVARDLFAAEIKAENIGNLSGENRERDTAGEANDDGIRDELDHRSELEDSEKYQKNAGEDGGCHESAESVGLDNTVDYDDERTGRTADLDLAAAEERDEESCYYRRDDSFFRRDAGCYRKGNRKRKRNDTDNRARHEVGHEGFLVVIADG